MGFKMFLLFSHKLTSDQESEAVTKWEIERFFYLPQKLQQRWSNIPPELEREELFEYLDPIKEWVEELAEEGDRILIQGDFGAVCHLVNFSKELGLVPLYATTKRVVEERETPGGIVKKSIFRHIRFRRF
ncbi:MAG: CRISPR-associated protein Csx20 [Campylobacterales bacterium]